VVQDAEKPTAPPAEPNAAGRAEWRVLIVDPQPAVRQVIGSFLSDFYRLSLAGNGEEALVKLGKQQVELVITDGRLHGALSVQDLMRQAREMDPQLPFIVMTPPGSNVQVEGALTCPKDAIAEESGRARMLLMVERAIRDHRQAREAQFRRRRSEHAAMTSESFLVGRSPAMEKLREQTRAAAQNSLSVLITGETGVGKTLVAETIHYGGENGQTQPFITVEPSALAASLFESELFGHARGAYTGATGAQAGAFEAAENGTLFLDEIGELSASLQTKILRAVERRIIRRVGDVREIQLNVRIITATNRDIEADVDTGRFRADLFQRLNETRLHIPPLRERPEDVVPLLVHFLTQLQPDVPCAVSPEAERSLAAYRWPGNVRELRTLARRLLANGPLASLDEEALGKVFPARIDRGGDSDLAPEERIRVFSRRVYHEVLEKHGFNIRATARAMGLPYHTLRSRLKNFGLLELAKDKKKGK
jgi:DNA-binding NtrC family response regulator